MLGPLRKFSGSIYSKILLGIVIIPFVFWGMGSSFTSGSKNIVLTIEKEKYSTQDFLDFVKRYIPPNQKVKPTKIDEIFSLYIGGKLIEKEIENFGINLSDISLTKLIKNRKEFKRENIFSRVEYEKFLLENNIPAAAFEVDLAKQEKKQQLLNFIGGGILPSKFLVNATYDKINHKRIIQVINLDNLFKKKISFSENEMKSYYEDNINNYKETYKSVKILELTPKKLVENNEFNEIFFEKIDEIDNIIVGGENLDFIIQKFNLGKANTFTLNKSGEDLNSKTITGIPIDLSEKIFSLDTDADPTALIETKDKYFIAEVLKTESIKKDFENESVKKSVISNLEISAKRKLIAEIVSKINQNDFVKLDFDQLAKNINAPIQKITLNNLNDNKILKKEIVSQIYAYPEKKVIIVHDIGLVENFLIFIDKIENVIIDEASDDYQKYLSLSEDNIAHGLFNTYDRHIKNKYKIDINYQALDTVKNYFN